MKAGIIFLSVLIAAVAAILWAKKDYKSWRDLGPGGLPSNWKGWLRMTQWRLKMDNPLASQKLQQACDGTHTKAFLATLPVREGRRPKVAPHPVPHRQLDQKITAPLKGALQNVFDQIQNDKQQKIFYRNSHFEKHTPALTLKLIRPDQSDACSSCGEIAHIHPSDGSMHMILSPPDAMLVLQKGWGESHGLAGKALGLPASYMLIYAPRNERDLEVIEAILAASVNYMTFEESHQANSARDIN